MDLTLSDDLYPLFRELLLTRAGLHYPERKRDDLTYGLNQAARTSGYDDLQSLYLDALKGHDIWQLIVEHLTIGETYFFRNRPQFEALQHEVLPELLQRQSGLHSLRFWSAGCASGEEPYSLAMLVQSVIPQHETWQVSILATDINTAFLNRAREALYSNWSFRETPDDIRDRFFVPEQNRWRLSASIRRQVLFAQLNLAEDSFPSIINGTCALDLIFCRNVMIYFDEATIQQVVNRFFHALAPGGWLFVGHAEPQARIFHQFEVHNFPHAVIYRKPLDAPLFSFHLPTKDPVAVARPHMRPPENSIIIPGHQPGAPYTPGSDLGAGSGTQSGGAHSSRITATPERGIIPRPVPAVEQRSVASTWPLALPTRSTPSTSSTSPLWDAIEKRLSQGDRAGAEALLQDLLRLAPNHVRALVALGQLHADRAEWSIALQQCEQALAHDPLSIEAHFILAQVYEHQGELDAALAAYRRTVYLDRTFIAGMLGMANVWRQLGRPADAARGYRNVLKQLGSMAPHTLIPWTDGATARELAGWITRQILSLNHP